MLLLLLLLLLLVLLLALLLVLLLVLPKAWAGWGHGSPMQGCILMAAYVQPAGLLKGLHAKSVLQA